MLTQRIPIKRHFINRTFCIIFKIAMLCSLVFYIILYGLAYVSAFAQRINPFDHQIVTQEQRSGHWLWECEEGGCFRTRNDNNTVKSKTTFTTISECRLVCLPYSTVWPQPTGQFKISRDVQKVELSKFSFHPERVRGGKVAVEFLRKNYDDIFIRYLEVMCPKCDHKESDCYTLSSNVATSQVSIFFITNVNDMTLNWNTDETYQLVINSTQSGINVYINATNVFGARHALQTLSQLFACRREEMKNVLVIISNAKISDKPAYSHRGLLLDTSRTFLSVESILRTLDGMSTSKLNVFHWHISDSHSFPYYSKSVPNLSRYGAYSVSEIYKPNDIKKIREYAFVRGIRIIVEIDAPAHAGYGWQWGESENKGELALCVGIEPWHEYCIQPPCGQLNPINPNVYSILEDLYRDIQDEFPKDMFHMGGDEVYFPCWLSDPAVTKWMKEHKMNQTDIGVLQLWSYFQNKALQAWDNAANTSNTPIILWSSQLTEAKTIDKYLSPNRYIIQMWTEKSDPAPLDLISKGYKVIMATKDAWYLDHGFWGSTTYHKWTDVYDNRIYEANLGVYGGEACMWGEYVGDTNLDSRLWPRVSCLGERLWSDPITTAQEALPRLLAHSDRLKYYSIKPDMITPEYCRQNDGKC